MSDAFYINAYKSCGISILVPNEPERKEINRIIFEELTHHKINNTSKEYFLEIIRGLAAEGAEGVILGCTEIKMLINQEDVPEIPLFDSLELHCHKAANIWIGNSVLE